MMLPEIMITRIRRNGKHNRRPVLSNSTLKTNQGQNNKFNIRVPLHHQKPYQASRTPNPQASGHKTNATSRRRNNETLG